ncbi:hypothetical protein ACFVIM_25345 [Streptomyces sp. NPDC057638]|uniref:hypothetical protein n=1 Tax=Streptomyces sp. NPDC057638 TaxID=3346190 RepID=UPI00367676AD
MSDTRDDRARVQEAMERAVRAAGATTSLFEHRPTEDGRGWVLDWEGTVDGETADLSVIGYGGDLPVQFFVDAWLLEGVAKSDIPAVIAATLGGGGARIVTSGRLFWKGAELLVPLPGGELTSSVRNPSDASPAPWEQRAAGN